MKNNITDVKIADPCLQNWDEMENYGVNKFCASCSKCVVDFSGYTNKEILQTLANSDNEICGRLTKNQLNQLNYQLIIAPVNRNWMKYLGVLAIGVSIFLQDANASITQASTEISIKMNNRNDDKKPLTIKKIYGYVFGADKKPIAGIRLTISNTKYFGLTDKNGRYEIKFNQGIDAKNSVLTVKSIRYTANKTLNFSAEKQSVLILSNMEPMIVGRIMVTKVNKTL